MKKGRRPISTSGPGLRSLAESTRDYESINEFANSTNYKIVDSSKEKRNRMTINRTPEFDAALLNISDRHKSWGYSEIIRNSVESLDFLENLIYEGKAVAITDDSGKIFGFVSFTD